MSILDWIKLILFIRIPTIPAFIHSRPAVADKRVISVRTACPYNIIVALLTKLFKLINLLNETKKYKILGLVGQVLCFWPRLWDLTKFFFHHITRYCYGGSTVVHFTGTEFIHTAFICHPGGCKISEVKAIRVPTSWACAEGTIQFIRYCIYTEFLRQRTFSGLTQNGCNGKQFLQGKKTKVLWNMNSKTIKVGCRHVQESTPETDKCAGTAHGFAARPNLNVPEVKLAHEEAFEQTIEWFSKMLVI